MFLIAILICLQIEFTQFQYEDTLKGLIEKKSYVANYELFAAGYTCYSIETGASCYTIGAGTSTTKTTPDQIHWPEYVGRPRSALSSNPELF